MKRFVCCILMTSLYWVSAFRMGTNTAVNRVLRSQCACRRLRMSSTDGPIREILSADMKEAMKSKDKIKLSSVRAILTAIKQKEVDDRVDVTNDMAIEIMSKLVKQRKESIKSYQDGGRPDLAEGEQLECDVITSYLPKQLSSAEVDQLITATIDKVGAATVKDMGKVMAELKPVLAGKADMSSVGNAIRERLGGKK